jgi:cruciform cutting endonuclease 1
VDGKICLAADRPAVHDLAGAYLRKWRGERTRKKQSSAADSASAVSKLDDLADCLLQGVTWVEWQAMRERLARKGLEAL